MKILFVSSLYAPYIGGGAEITLKTLVEALQALGVEVVVITIGPQPGVIEEQVNGVRVWRIGIRNLYFHHGKISPPAWLRMFWHAFDIYNPLMKSHIRRVVEIEKPDVASVHNLPGWSISAWDALTECGVPIVQVLHDQYLLCPKNAMFRNNTACQRQCTLCRVMRASHPGHSNQVSAVVGVSRYMRDKLLSNGYFRNTPIKDFIHNVRRLPFNPATLLPRHLDGNVIFGFIGTLAPHKGIELLLNTFLGHGQPNWRLRIAGTGKSDYETMLKVKYAHPNIAFLGHCEPTVFFQNVDITVVPSLWEEPLGMVVAESIIFGIPVLGSLRGGIPEMITPNENGLLFDPDQPDTLAKNLQMMADDINTWRERRESIQKAAMYFSDQKTWIFRWLEIYKSAINKYRNS